MVAKKKKTPTLEDMGSSEPMPTNRMPANTQPMAPPTRMPINGSSGMPPVAIVKPKKKK